MNGAKIVERGWLFVIAAVAAGAGYYLWRRTQVLAMKANGTGAFDPSIAGPVANWAAQYGVDPNAVYAIILNEGSYTPDGGAYPAGDGGTSHGPMQVHRGSSGSPAVIDAFEQANGVTIDDSSLDAVGSDQAIQIGVWGLAQAFQASKGDAFGAFRRYNGSGPMAEAYAARALAKYEGLA